MIQSERLAFRPLRLRDVDALFDVFADEGARRFYPQMARRSARVTRRTSKRPSVGQL